MADETEIQGGAAAPEAAAALSFPHFDQLQAFNRPQQRSWRLFGSELSEAVAAVVEGGTALKTGTYVAYVEFVDQEL
jgi:hypothetical protein